jgi:hypothetical protein
MARQHSRSRATARATNASRAQPAGDLLATRNGARAMCNGAPAWGRARPRVNSLEAAIGVGLRVFRPGGAPLAGPMHCGRANACSGTHGLENQHACATCAGRGAGRTAPENAMDHYIPKRRVPVNLWSRDHAGAQGDVFLDLDATGGRHQTILARLNEPARFLPVATGADGRIQLFRKSRLVRVTAGPLVLQSDVFSRGFLPWREEEGTVWLSDGTTVSGRVWMPLERPTQRVSDFLNQIGWEFFVLLTDRDVQLVNSEAVVRVDLTETAGAPLDSLDSRIESMQWPDPAMFVHGFEGNR